MLVRLIHQDIVDLQRVGIEHLTAEMRFGSFQITPKLMNAQAIDRQRLPISGDILFRLDWGARFLPYLQPISVWRSNVSLLKESSLGFGFLRFPNVARVVFCAHQLFNRRDVATLQVVPVERLLLLDELIRDRADIST